MTMRIATSLLIFAGLTASALPALAGDTHTYKVELNKTEIVRLPGAASSIVVGNPKIADVTVQSVDTIFVVGRGYGETNLIVLDAQGNTMMQADLQVVNTLSPHGVRLYNAKSRETYSCIPYCGPSPVLGDSNEFISGNTSTDREIDTTVAGVGQSNGNNQDQFNNENVAGGSSGGPTATGF